MYEWHLPNRVVRLEGRALVMGIVNVTPDSFSDGGRFLPPDAALAQALDLVSQGADLLDIGGESSRPGAEPVAEAEELRASCRWSASWPPGPRSRSRWIRRRRPLPTPVSPPGAHN